MAEMLKLSDMLGDVLGKNREIFDKAFRGEGGPSGAYDTLLPTELEYRCIIDSSVFGKSKGSGRLQITLTYEVLEPVEYAGTKLADYIDPKPTNEIGSRKLAGILGALQANVEGWGDDFEGFVKQFEGRTAVISVRRWGEEMDRNGVRFTNQDKGQKLRTNVQPQKPSTSTAKNLRPEINIPKDEPTNTEIVSPPPVAPTLPSAPSGGANLPPGLRPS